jgi:ribosomal protein L23
MESTTLDLPQPFGPTIAVTPSLKLMVILSPKLLKPLISNLVSCIYFKPVLKIQTLKVAKKLKQTYEKPTNMIEFEFATNHTANSRVS